MDQKVVIKDVVQQCFGGGDFHFTVVSHRGESEIIGLCDIRSVNKLPVHLQEDVRQSEVTHLEVPAQHIPTARILVGLPFLKKLAAKCLISTIILDNTKCKR